MNLKNIVEDLKVKAQAYWKRFLLSKRVWKVIDKADYIGTGFTQIFLTNRWWSISSFAIPYLCICVLVDVFKYDAIRLYWRDDVVLAVMLILTEVSLKWADNYDKTKKGAT